MIGYPTLNALPINMKTDMKEKIVEMSTEYYLKILRS